MDRFGRTVAEVFRGGDKVNVRLVRSGQAFAFGRYLAQCDGQQYGEAERFACSQSRGVWTSPAGITRPWTWRAGSPAATPPFRQD
jgi:endonuclease YncB( thermonuclease family)